MRLRISVLILLFLGVGLIQAAFNDNYAAWVSLPSLIIASSGAALIICGVCLWGSNQLCDGQNCTNNVDSTLQWSPWALGTLTTVVVVITPPALNPAMVPQANHTAASAGDPSTWPEIDDSSPELSLYEVTARSIAPADGRLNGKQAKIKGQISTTDKGARMLSRVTVTCCAADARRYQVEFNDPVGKLDEIKDGQWVVVTVGFHPGTATPERRWIPLMEVKHIRPIEIQTYEKQS